MNESVELEVDEPESVIQIIKSEREKQCHILMHCMESRKGI